jgi:outer membrane protein
VCALLISGMAEADTLREALVRVYQANPTITAQRAQLRVTDEVAAGARAGLRPQLSGTLGVNQDVLTTGQSGSDRNFSAGVDVSYPLFNGGRVRNAIRAADTRVEAGRATLRAVEGDVFTEAVAAYMDVIRDRSIVTLNQNQVRVLETNLQASRDRFEVGDLTRTDVAQSEARLSLARSSLALAQGRLRGSEENYRRLIGKLPDELQPPPPLPPLPATPDQAVDIALANNPDIIAIVAQARAAGFDVVATRAERLPTVNAVSTGRYFNALGSQPLPQLPNSETSAGVGAQVRIPLYQGGLIGARVRQAQAIQNQVLEQGVAVERAVVSNTRAAFASYQAALDSIRSNEIAVAANSLALEGTRAEQTVGTRNVLDVLNAEQELLNSQVALVTARRDAYVAGFALLNAMGQAEADDLNLDAGQLYDPAANYNRTIRRTSDWSDGPTPAPVATRTIGPVDTAPATPTTQPGTQPNTQPGTQPTTPQNPVTEPPR